MIANIVKGRAFRGALDYVLGKKDAVLLHTTLGSKNARGMSVELSAYRNLRPSLGKAVFHCSLAIGNGDSLSPEQWHSIAEKYLDGMGFGDAPWTLVRHLDADHDHVHIVASRVRSDGSVVSDSRDFERTEELLRDIEKEYGLTEVVNSKDAKVRAVTIAELEQADRKGTPPPRLILQELVSRVADQSETFKDFALKLDAAGVDFKPTLQQDNTKWSGAAFRLRDDPDGIWFGGSKLASNLKVGALIKRGIEYVKNRDIQTASICIERAELAPIKTTARVDQCDQSARAGDPAATSGSEQLLDGEFSTADSTHSSAVRPDQPSSTPEHSSPCGSDQPASDQQLTAAVAAAGWENGHIGQDFGQGEPVSRVPRESPKADQPGGLESARGSWSDTAPTLEATINSGSSGRDAGQRSHTGWNARFKAVSAKARDKRHAATEVAGASNTSRNRVAPGDLQALKSIDPRPFIERMGYMVKKDGQRHFSIRHGKDEAYRLTQKPDNTWVWVDKHGTHGGDNIDLVKELSGLDRFIDCVYELNGGLRATPVPVPVALKPPRVPPESLLGREAGRMYLNDRGISDPTIDHAERSGFLRYLADGILFVGHHAGKIWNATKRSIMPDAEIPKRDLAGSDKSKPQILTGNPSTIWIVEGGIDALAVQDIAKRQGKTPPTVIVSGGSGVKSFLENPEIMEKIRVARLVVVAGENEKNADVQAKTDAQHAMQLELVKALNPSAQAIAWKPESHMGSDIADYNLSIKNQKQAQKEIDITQEVKPRSFDM